MTVCWTAWVLPSRKKAKKQCDVQILSNHTVGQFFHAWFWYDGGKPEYIGNSLTQAGSAEKHVCCFWADFSVIFEFSGIP